VAYQELIAPGGVDSRRGGGGFPGWFPVRFGCTTAPRDSRDEPGTQPWALALNYGDGVVVQVVPGQAEVQVPALRAAVGPASEPAA
jgi:hypothetical protein